MNRTALLLLPLALALSACAGMDQVTFAGLDATIVDAADGRPIEGAQVLVLSPRPPSGYVIQASDASGRVAIPPFRRRRLGWLPTAPRTVDDGEIRVAAPGYGVQTLKVSMACCLTGRPYAEGPRPRAIPLVRQ